MKRIFNSRQRDIFGTGYMELANLSFFSYIVTKDQY